MLTRWLRLILNRGVHLAERLKIKCISLHPSITIKQPTYIAWSAKIGTEIDGRDFGGSITIGNRCTISDGVILAPYGGSIELGDNIFIGPHCVIYGHGGLRIGSNTMIAAHTIIIPANHNFSDPDRLIQDQGETRRGITIEDDCWIGSGVRICDGVTLGRGTVVGAGSVVTKSLPAGIIAVGVPARQIKSRRTKS